MREPPHKRLSTKPTQACFVKILRTMRTIRLGWTSSSPIRDYTESYKTQAFMKHPTAFDLDWLVGFIEADGTFSCTKTATGKVQTAFKITQKPTNIRALIACKKIIGTGQLTQDGQQAVYRIRKHHVLKTHLFPLLEQAHFNTRKYAAYQHLKHYVQDRVYTPFTPPQEPGVPRWQERLDAPTWEHFLATGWLRPTKAASVLSLGWLTGFIEGDGSFYIVKKGDGRYACGFGLTQKHGFLLLSAIRSVLKIQAQVKPHSTAPDVWCLDTTSKGAAEHIAQTFQGCFKGHTALRFRLWVRALRSSQDGVKLQKLQKLLRKVS